VTVGWEGPAWLETLARRINMPIFDRVVAIHLKGPSFDDSVVPQLANLSHLEAISLIGTRISNDGLMSIQNVHPKCTIYN
jgi:hypothetical protein